MSGKSTTFGNDILKLIFWGTAIADLAENDTTSPLTQFYCALHTADPTDAGTQASNEISYTGYARVPATRNSAAWAITNDVVHPNYAIDFPARTDVGTATATHFSIGVAASGATKLLYSGAIAPTISVTQGVTPRIGTSSAVTEG